MKTSRILLLGAAAVLMVACSKEDMDSNCGNAAGELVPMTFTAEVPQDVPLTRTQLVEGNAVHWTEGDKIAVWSTGSSTKNEFKAVSIDGSKAVFSGEAEVADNYVAVYPYSAAEKDPGTSGSSDYFKFNVPAAQTAVAGTFATNLAPSWAKTTEGSTKLEFHNLCALLKFTIGDDIASEGTFTFQSYSAYDIIAGDSFRYFYNYNDLKKENVANGSFRITLSGTFEAGQSYYIVVAPSYLRSGFSLLFETSDGKLYRKATTKAFALNAGEISNLGTLEASNMEKAMWYDLYKNIPGANSYKNFDWTVTLSESDLTNMASLTELNLSGKSLSSLGSITYYCPNLQKLDCSNNKLKKLDVSGLTGLTELNCSGNRDLVELNFVGMAEPARQGSSMDKNFTTMRAGSSSKLKRLECSNTGLKKLDVSGLTALTYLDCGHNYELSKLNIDGIVNLEELICYETALTSLDVSKLTVLRHLECWSNRTMTSLNVSGLEKLKHLNCNYCALTELNLSGVTGLTYLNCYQNTMDALDITQQTLLETLYCGEQWYSPDGTLENINGLKTITLTLTSAQKTKWDSAWGNEKWGNSNVILNVKN